MITATALAADYATPEDTPIGNAMSGGTKDTRSVRSDDIGSSSPLSKLSTCPEAEPEYRPGWSCRERDTCGFL